MLDKLIFFLTRKKGVTYLTTNILTPVYVIIDDSNFEDVSLKIINMHDNLISLFFVISLAMIMLYRYFFNFTENILYQYIVFPAFAISISLIFSGIVGMYFVKQKICFGFINPFNTTADGTKMPLHFLYFYLMIFLFLFLSALVSVGIWCEALGKGLMFVIFGLITLIITSSAITIGLKLLRQKYFIKITGDKYPDK